MPTGIKRLCYCKRGTMDDVKGGFRKFAAGATLSLSHSS